MRSVSLRKRGFEMCETFSGILFRNDDWRWAPEYTDHYSVMIRAWKLKEAAGIAGGFVPPSAIADQTKWAKFEFTPKGYKTEKVEWDNVEGYTLRIDEDITPEWLTQDKLDKLTKSLRHEVGKMIIRDKRDLLLGGVYILARGADVGELQSCRVVAMTGDAQVGVMRGTSQVGEMWGTSRVGVMRGTSQVGVMWETSQVGVMRGTSQVGEMWGTSQVGEMWGTSQVGVMRGTSQVGEMWGTSRVGVMWETSQVPGGKKPDNDKRDEVPQ